MNNCNEKDKMIIKNGLMVSFLMIVKSYSQQFQL